MDHEIAKREEKYDARNRDKQVENMAGKNSTGIDQLHFDIGLHCWSLICFVYPKYFKSSLFLIFKALF
jgi:hypothetical protein